MPTHEDSTPPDRSWALGLFVRRAEGPTAVTPRRPQAARRALLHAGAAAALALPAARSAFGALPPAGEDAQAAPEGARRLALHHTHTGESLSLVYAVGDAYLPGALAEANRFLRDHYSGEVGQIDAALLDRLHALALALGAPARFEVISGFRGPATNEMLRRRGGGGVARNSLHLQGRAIDVRMPGVELRALRDAALDLRAGGVGFYPESQFVHLDTGRVRSW